MECRKMVSALALAGVFAMQAVAASAQTQIRMLKTWDARYPGSTVICDRFAGMIDEASKGSIKVQVSGPETIPPLDQLDPTRNGLFQILCTYPGFHIGATTLLSGLESIEPDAEAFRASGGMAVVDEHYAKLGLKALAVPLAHGVTFFLKKPLSDKGDLTGLQIRALPANHPYVTALGGTPVTLTPPEMFSALERGVVDGAFFPTAGASGYGFAEVTDRFVANVGLTLPHVILANAAFWAGLDDATKAMISEQAAALEDETPGVYEKLNAEESAKLKEKGMQAVELSPAATDALTKAVAQASWDYASTRAAEDAKELKEKVSAAGLISQ